MTKKNAGRICLLHPRLRRSVFCWQDCLCSRTAHRGTTYASNHPCSSPALYPCPEYFKTLLSGGSKRVPHSLSRGPTKMKDELDEKLEPHRPSQLDLEPSSFREASFRFWQHSPLSPLMGRFLLRVLQPSLHCVLGTKEMTYATSQRDTTRDVAEYNQCHPLQVAIYRPKSHSCCYQT
jgi:hypothetical protein